MELTIILLSITQHKQYKFYSFLTLLSVSFMSNCLVTNHILLVVVGPRNKILYIGNLCNEGNHDERSLEHLLAWYEPQMLELNCSNIINTILVNSILHRHY